MDDRTAFFENKENKLYLYSYIQGTPTNFDGNPTVDISDSNGDPLTGFTGLTTVLRTQGVYECTIPPINGYTTPCQFTDTWKNISIDGVSISNIDNDFVIRPASEYCQIGTVDRKSTRLNSSH